MIFVNLFRCLEFEFLFLQALTRARVPIVKLMDPATGISCDICINNVLAVVNTKLLRDYAQIDVRLRQLAYIVKHWAKSRGVNETYQGTLSSYAWVFTPYPFFLGHIPYPFSLYLSILNQPQSWTSDIFVDYKILFTFESEQKAWYFSISVMLEVFFFAFTHHHNAEEVGGVILLVSITWFFYILNTCLFFQIRADVHSFLTAASSCYSSMLTGLASFLCW